MKLGLLLGAKEAFVNIGKTDIPIVTAWKIAKILTKLTEEEKLFTEQNLNLFRKYGEEIGDGNLKIKEENMPIYRKEFASLMEAESDYEPQIKIKLSELGDIKVQPLDLIKIEPFLDVEDDDIMTYG